MNRFLSIAIVITTICADLLTSILVFILPAHNKEIENEIYLYDFSKSVFDLLLVSGLRSCILIGACCGVLINPIGAKIKINKTKKFIIYFSCVIAVFGIFKILYYTEDNHENMDKRVWTLIGITLASSLMIYSSWIILGSYTYQSATLKRNLNVNVSKIEEPDQSSDSSSITDVNEDINNEDQLNEIDKIESEKFTTGSTVIKLLKLAKKDAFYILLALIFLTTCSVAQIFLPFYTGKVVNYIVIEKSPEKFKTAMLYMSLITLVAGFASGIRAGLFTFVLARYILRLQNLLFKSIMHMEIGFFDVRKTGEITSRLTSDCTKIGDTVGLNINVFLRNVVKIIGILFFMVHISWKLSVVTLISIPVIAIFSEAFGDKIRKISEKIQSSLAHANESAEEAISSIRTVRSFAAETNEVDRYDQRLQVTYNLRKKEAVITCGYRWSTEVTDLAMALMILYYGGHLVIKNDLTGGELISFVLYSFELGFCLEEIGDVYTGLMEAVGASKSVLLYIERKPQIPNDGYLKSDEGVKGEIQFRNVSFSYPSRPDIEVLNDISFSAKEGEIVALVGPSGGGKTSIVNLLEHFYTPTKGEILIDNVNLREYDHKFIHDKISMVQQEPVLFARTIYENIAYGLCFDASMEAVKKSAVLANASTFIDNLTDGYHTETGEKGIQLSGGQKQRVAIARALIRNPSVLILDEATSALDSESEYLVQQAINQNLHGHTVIVIAHRLSTIEKADKILVIEKGKLVEEGKHLELINKSGVYSALVKRQILGMETSSGAENASKDS